MKIKSVHIKNYRALTDIHVDFDTVTTFIGPNGVGKSSILRALDWYFNGKTGL
jgi:predicted ATP-dependent endonuclease of OLD family